MDAPIITVEAFKAHVRKKAYIAFITGAGRDSHGMNPSSAVDDFQAEYDRLEQEARACQPSQSTRPARRRFDHGQGGASC